MKWQLVMSITAFIGGELSFGKAAAQFNFTAQDRSVTAEAHAFDMAITAPPPVDDVKSASAPDFSDFNPSLTAVATLTDSKFSGTASSAASQNSHLSSTNITASGAVSVKGYRFAPNLGEALANSMFSSTFVITSPVEVQINVNLAGHIGSFVPFFNIGVAAFSLTGGTINLTSMTAIPQGQMDGIAQLNQNLSLEVGTYTVTASTHGDSGSPNLGAELNSDLSARANYSISISVVPEPSSLVLCAICTVALLLLSLT
jgi:hypothetical protein